MKNILKVLFLAVILGGCGKEANIKIIFDTDFGGDADDLAALVMLHNLAGQGECELTAIMCWSTEESAIPAIDAVNRWYGHPDIPLGLRKEGSHVSQWNYTSPIAQNFEHRLTPEQVRESTDLYRDILSGSEDHSITLVTVGPLKNILNLLDSEADTHSPLSGRELVNRKIKEVVIMGGNFPSGENEWNFNGNMPGVTRAVLEELDIPVVFSGFELGVKIKTGAILNEVDEQTPLHTGFLHFSQHAPWIKQDYKGEILDNSSFDQTAVLYAVRNGVGNYWDKVEGGRCMADDSGGNTWTPMENSKHSYLKLSMPADEIANLIEAIMLNDF